MTMKKPVCAICSQDLLTVESYCAGCAGIAGTWQQTQPAVQEATAALPGDEEMGAIMRRRLLAWVHGSSNAELGAFARLIREGTAGQIAEAGSSMARLINS